MIFHFSNNLRNFEIPDIAIKGINIVRVNSYTCIEMENHVNIIANNITKNIGILTHIKHYDHTDIFKKLVSFGLTLIIDYFVGDIWVWVDFSGRSGVTVSVTGALMRLFPNMA